MNYHKFLSEKYPDSVIVIGERPDGTYFIPAASDQIPADENVFQTIEQIEEVLDDSLTLIMPKNDVN